MIFMNIAVLIRDSSIGFNTNFILRKMDSQWLILPKGHYSKLNISIDFWGNWLNIFSKHLCKRLKSRVFAPKAAYFICVRKHTVPALIQNIPSKLAFSRCACTVSTVNWPLIEKIIAAKNRVLPIHVNSILKFWQTTNPLMSEASPDCSADSIVLR